MKSTIHNSLNTKVHYMYNIRWSRLVWILKDTSFFSKWKKKQSLLYMRESSREANIKAIFEKNNSHQRDDPADGSRVPFRRYSQREGPEDFLLVKAFGECCSPRQDMERTDRLTPLRLLFTNLHIQLKHWRGGSAGKGRKESKKPRRKEKVASMSE